VLGFGTFGGGSNPIGAAHENFGIGSTGHASVESRFARPDPAEAAVLYFRKPGLA